MPNVNRAVLMAEAADALDAYPKLVEALEDALQFAAEALDLMEPGRTPTGPRFARWRAALASTREEI